jgi:uncharacterized protein YqeY
MAYGGFRQEGGRNKKIVLFQLVNIFAIEPVLRYRVRLPSLLEVTRGMLRQQFNEALKAAMLAKDSRTVSTVRLIVAALKDRDIAARSRGVTDGISDDEILQMLSQMVKQRRESITLYEQGARLDLAQQETEEIAIISRFMPKQMSDAEMTAAVKKVLAEIDAKGLKDMGRTMAVLKERFAGSMDFTKASGIVKAQLG